MSVTKMAATYPFINSVNKEMEKQMIYHRVNKQDKIFAPVT